MSLPPPPDPFGSPSPRNGGGGQQWGGPPQQGPGGQPPYVGGQPPEQQGPPIHHGQPPQMPPPPGQHGAPPPSWAPQQQWSGGPPPPPAPPSKGGKGKWILVGLALIAVIALSVVGTVLVLRPESNNDAGGGDNGGGNPPTSATSQNGKSEFASANDTGPVNVITEDPTCAAWTRVGREYADKLASVGWDKSDNSIPASAWTAEYRTMYETVRSAMNRIADQVAPLAKQTPHRVSRELYQQFIAYTKTFSSKIPAYVPDDRKFAVVSDAIGNGLNNICSAISFGSIQPVAPSLDLPEAPSGLAAISDGEPSTLFVGTPTPACDAWAMKITEFDTKIAEWLALDPQIPAADWTPEQRRVNEDVLPVMTENAAALMAIGRQSRNPVFEDIATLASQYRRAFVVAAPTYTVADNYLSEAAAFLSKTINLACSAAGQ